MNRWLLSLSLCCGAALLVAAPVRAQVSDKVHYIDRAAAKPDPKKPTPPPVYEGEVVKEDATGITIKDKAKGNKEVPAADIRDVVYDTRIVGFDKVKGRHKEGVEAEAAFFTPKNPAEEKDKAKNLKKALEAYEEVLASKNEKLTKQFNRQLEYKIAMLGLLQVAGNKAGEDEAIKKLIAFREKYPDCWQISSVQERLAEMQMAREEYKDAVKTIDEILKLKGLSEETTGKYQMLSADALVKGGDYAGADKRISEILGKLKPDDPQVFPLKMRQIKCQAATPEKVNEAITNLNKIIKATPEDNKTQKAIAHNTLGDCLLMSKDKKGEAVYEFLTVEVWYKDNEQELAKAYSELAKIYANERKNDARSKDYQEKLAKLKRAS